MSEKEKDVGQMRHVDQVKLAHETLLGPFTAVRLEIGGVRMHKLVKAILRVHDAKHDLSISKMSAIEARHCTAVLAVLQDFFDERRIAAIGIGESAQPLANLAADGVRFRAMGAALAHAGKPSGKAFELAANKACANPENVEQLRLAVDAGMRATSGPAIRGECLGAPHADFPPDLSTWEERVAYQRGVADARRIGFDYPQGQALQERVEQLERELEAVGAGGVQPLQGSSWEPLVESFAGVEYASAVTPEMREKFKAAMQEEASQVAMRQLPREVAQIPPCKYKTAISKGEDLHKDVSAILGMLQDREWAELPAKSELGGQLADAITELHNEIHASEDLRTVGEALLKAIDACKPQLEKFDWMGPADCPSEIVVDLVNKLEEQDAMLDTLGQDRDRVDFIEQRALQQKQWGITLAHYPSDGGFTYMHRHYRSAYRLNLREVIDFERGIMPTLPENKAIPN